MIPRLLPWEYAVRNLLRRPVRTCLTFAGLTTVIVLVFASLGFVRGLDHSLEVTGDSATVLVYSLGMGENLEYSSIPMRTADVVAANVSAIRSRSGHKYVSPELYLGTQVSVEGGEPSMGLLRGVTRSAFLVRRTVEIEAGTWPESGEVLVGRMVAAKLGVADELSPGSTLEFEGRRWRVAGVFSAVGSAFESEIWCRLNDLQQVLQRQDLSLAAVSLGPEGSFADIDLFCKERLDLELQAIRETDYYASLQRDYAPVRSVVWIMTGLVAMAGVLAGLNTLYGSVVGRTSEFSMLRTLGFLRRAVLISVIHEGLLLSAAASLLAAAIAVMFIDGSAVRFTMGAFALRIDNAALLVGLGVGIALGFLGALPPAVRALRMSVVAGLNDV